MIVSSRKNENRDKKAAVLKRENFTAWCALKHHRTHTGKRLTFHDHHYLKEIYFDKNPFIAIIKSTQCAITEYLICRALTKSIKGWSVFYVLPTYNLVQRVVKNRLDKSVQNTLYYQTLEKMVNKDDSSKRSQSMSLKHYGAGAIAFVGSNSTVGFTEYPADELIIDEQDECDQDNLAMAWERLSHSEYRYQVRAGNPTIEGYGIDLEYKDTDQKEWLLRCPKCRKWTNIDWYKNVVREIEDQIYVIRDEDFDWNKGTDIRPVCSCGRPIDRHSNGVWVNKVESHKSGYAISKLFSGKTTMIELMDRFQEGLTNPAKMQRFQNADLGKAYTSKGAKVDEGMLNQCMGEYKNGKISDAGIGIMGIDVGAVLNIMIGRLLPNKKIMVTYITEMEPDEKAVIELIERFGVKIVVVDALPELYFVKKLKAVSNNVFSCYFNNSKKDPVDTSRNVSVDRTSTLDEVRELLYTKGMILPAGSNNIPGFYEQMTASTRIFDEKIGKTGAYVWREGTRPDHYFLTAGYMVIAAKIIVKMTS